MALPPSEAFRIEYWLLEEAKIRRQPPEKELSRRVAVVVGGGNGIGRAATLLAAQRGANVVAADRDTQEAANTTESAKQLAGKEAAMALTIDIRDRKAIHQALREVIANYGGFDILINTAAIFPTSSDGSISDEQWGATLDLNVTANHRLCDEAAQILREQDMDIHRVDQFRQCCRRQEGKRSLRREQSRAEPSDPGRSNLARAENPGKRNQSGYVVKGSTMFPRDRVITSLKKYGIGFDAQATDDQLRALLADFYAKRTLTHQAIDPDDCAHAILFLASPKARCTTGHLIPVDGGLVDAFLR